MCVNMCGHVWTFVDMCEHVWTCVEAGQPWIRPWRLRRESRTVPGRRYVPPPLGLHSLLASSSTVLPLFGSQSPPPPSGILPSPPPPVAELPLEECGGRAGLEAGMCLPQQLPLLTQQPPPAGTEGGRAGLEEGMRLLVCLLRERMSCGLRASDRLRHTLLHWLAFR